MLLVGNVAGEVVAYEGLDEQLVEFEKLVAEDFATVQVGANASPILLTDGNTADMQLLVGNRRGGIQLYTVPKNLFWTTRTDNLVEAKNTFKIVPNPTSSGIQMEGLEIQAACMMLLFDAQGRLVVEKGLSDNDIDLGAYGLGKGFYFVQVVQRDGQVVGFGRFVYSK